ncbi:MAG TPA: peptidoglycan-binding domain-containing protein [Acidimicrobiales bacterium]
MTATDNPTDESPEVAGPTYPGRVKHTSTGPAVGVWQRLLNSRGGYGLKVDNIYGKNTAKAVVDWQTKRPASRELDGVCAIYMWHDLTQVRPYSGETVEEIDVDSLPEPPADFGPDSPYIQPDMDESS